MRKDRSNRNSVTAQDQTFLQKLQEGAGVEGDEFSQDFARHIATALKGRPISAMEFVRQSEEVLGKLRDSILGIARLKGDPKFSMQVEHIMSGVKNTLNT